MARDLDSPYERIQQLIGLIDRNPSKKQVVKFLSRQLDPMGEISGVSWMTLDESGYFSYPATSGTTSRLDAQVKVSLSDDNAVAESLRLGKMQIWDMKDMYRTYSDATHHSQLDGYLSGMALPLNERQILGCALNSPVSLIKEYSAYFECLRLLLALWLSRISLNASGYAKKEPLLSSELTERQESILAMVRDGKTNNSISIILGYSESLIRQETIIIYKKLGVSGRRELEIPHLPK